MKILLINPPNLNHIQSVLPDMIEEERGFNPPLGLLYLAGYLQKYSPEIEIKIIDCLAEQLDYVQLQKKIINFSPDVVGLTAMSFNLIDALEIIKLIKKINPEIKTVIGGPHVNIYPQETLNLGNIDFIILGEGEKVFYDLITSLEDEERFKKIPGLIFLNKNKKIVHTGFPPFVENLDELPLPARNLIDNNKYSSVLGTSKLVTTIITSRGCPYKCLFCDRPHLGKKFRARSADNVLLEIKDCLKYGIKEFLMYDDTFTVDRQRVVNICNKILEENLDIKWDIRARVNTVNEKLLKLLKEAGCVRIHYGVESGTQRILDILRKGITLNQVEEIFKLTKRQGIETLAYFMIGNPEETEAEIKKTVKFAKKIKPDYVHITATIPFPATDLYRLALEKKIIPKDVWLEYAKNPGKNFVPPLWEENLTAPELSNHIKKAYREFYLRPKYIFKKISEIKNLPQLFRRIKMAKAILFP